MTATVAERRLKGVAAHLSPPNDLVVVLPDDARVTRGAVPGPVDVTRLALDDRALLEFSIIADRTYAYDLSSVGTRYEGKTTHVPQYKLLQVNPSSGTLFLSVCTIPDFWAAIYGLWTIFHEKEYIPISLSTLENGQEIASYLLTTALARLYPNKKRKVLQKEHDLDDVFFLNRAAFWQGAGVEGYHTRSWIPHPSPAFPLISSFTRQENIIAKHPLRPPKPAPGEVMYRRWCSAVGQMLDLTHFDLDGVSDPSQESAGGLSRHMAAFHRWHNDERVNSAWGEQGNLETHRAYIRKVLADPHVIPCMFSWDGELMGYIEINYTKEDHAAPYFPFGDPPGDWDRGIHVLVGETKFLGGGRSEIWIRSLIHYIFLTDPRANRVLGEPDAGNAAILRAADASEFHRVITFDFPYKRSVMVLHTRDKFFTICRLR